MPPFFVLPRLSVFWRLLDAVQGLKCCLPSYIFACRFVCFIFDGLSSVPQPASTASTAYQYTVDISSQCTGFPPYRVAAFCFVSFKLLFAVTTPGQMWDWVGSDRERRYVVHRAQRARPSLFLPLSFSRFFIVRFPLLFPSCNQRAQPKNSVLSSKKQNDSRRRKRAN